ncbi:OLC1v1025877C5 [Oldenlandia corymbosa var. corymbosa]|uniref:ATP-dependent helicase ATRX n=1 Tax=Oldenlandia corymbosa var. corymbosa TaxID=529605 RepID=A0AAV1C5Q1_OLDCO|nr:OLC1v1025877C5 [Oldenlandia corymbosa var. corymbosa]
MDDQKDTDKDNQDDEKENNHDDDEMGDIENDEGSSDSFIDESDDTDGEVSQPEEPLTEQETEELINELIEVESKAAEAQEALEQESLAKVEAEVREELQQTLDGDDLEKAVAEEMQTLKEDWENVLDELETESSYLLEQLDGAGIELSKLYKWIESQVPLGCSTEAWKMRTHWVGSQLNTEGTNWIAEADKYLQTHRPVRKHHGKVLEEGASGFLERKLAVNAGHVAATDNLHVDWYSFNQLCSDKSSLEGKSFGSKEWASVYLAETPQQAAELGIKFPGVDEVEEIGDIESSSVPDAIAIEGDSSLTEEQKRKFRKVKEEDDTNIIRKLQNKLKRRRQIKKSQKETLQTENYSEVLSLDCIANPENLDCGGGDTLLVAQSASPSFIDSGDKKFSDDRNQLDCENLITRSPLRLNGSAMMDVETEENILSSEVPLQKIETKEFHCTACDKLSRQPCLHPLMKVIICLDCKKVLESKMAVKDIDCSECYCGWCGQNSNLRSCKSCRTFFCTSCIKRNLGENFLSQIQKFGWQCCCCSPSVLRDLISEAEKVTESGVLIYSSSDTDSDDSDSNAVIDVSTRRRRKKKIRRILDDTELGEETKRKIAIEKERQERLKSLEAQFAKKSSMASSASCTWHLLDGGSNDMLGDTVTGYIVNVVRDEGEDPVRIPPSISDKLKSHQIAGVRFMWQNVIESVKRVKSGDKGLGCILAHTMGLGKTLQVIAFLYAVMQNADLGLRTVLIVTPVSVQHNWRNEFNKWKPLEVKPLRVFMLDDVPRERRAEWLLKWRSKGGVFLISYAAFRSLSLGKSVKDREAARQICTTLQDGPDILVCDEAHIIKNTRADVTQALKQVKCQRRIALTGSPLQNNLMEYYCMVDFVREGFLGSRHEFRNRFQNPIENGQLTNSTASDVKIMNHRSHILYEQLKGFVQRMDMTVVKDDLPPKTVFVVAVKLSPLQRKLYKRFLDVHGFTKDKAFNEKVKRRCFFAGYQALAQIWNHPGILQLMKEGKESVRCEDDVEHLTGEDSSSDENIDDNVIPGEKLGNSSIFGDRKNDNGFLHEDWWSDLLQNNTYEEVDYSGKMVLLMDILKMCSDMGDKALVFSQSLSTLDLIEIYLSKLSRPGKSGKCWKRGKDWYRLDGKTLGSERQKLVEKFNDPSNRRVKCTLISTRAGSLGINLHSANRVIIVDGSWNPTYDLQAIFRAWRYGQTKPVFAYRLLGHGTMEEKIYKRQVTKEGLAARVVDRQQVYRTISKEEMLHLFDFGDDENADPLLGLVQENSSASDFSVSSSIGGFTKQKVPSPGSMSSDKVMQSLITRHQLRWIANYHEHETLLQENEEEKLSKEEQEQAWEVYRKTFPVECEWEEVSRISPDESTFEQHQLMDVKPGVKRKTSPTEQQKLRGGENAVDLKKPSVASNSLPSAPEKKFVYVPERAKDRITIRKCTNLSHLLTLRSQGTKMGCCTVCGECAQEISWETLNRTANK